MRKVTITAVALSLLISSPLFAGDYKKCDSSADDCLTMMTQKFKDKGWVGIEYDHDEATGAITVERVIPDSPAYKAKLQKGDVLVKVNGVGFGEDEQEARVAATKSWSPGDTATYTIRRDGEEMPIKLVLGEVPKDVMAQWVGNHMLEHHVPTATMAKN